MSKAFSSGWEAGGNKLAFCREVVLEKSQFLGNREGFNFREQNRKTPTIEDRAERWIWNRDHIVRHNVLAYNRDAQTWGWFDIADGRHWPAAVQEAGEREQGRSARDLAADYQSQDTAGAPEGLSLEKLQFGLGSNT